MKNIGNVAQAQAQAQNTGKTKQDGACRHGVQYRPSDDARKTHVSDDVSLQQILGEARSEFVVELMSKGDAMTEEDLAILAEVQANMQAEQEQLVEEPDNFVCTLSKCYIGGCEVHTLLPNYVHYGKNPCGYSKFSDMDPRTKKGYEVYMAHPGCNYVEVYERHVCVVSSNGVTEVIDE